MRERPCDRCGARLSERKITLEKPYKYALSGLDNLYLAGITVRECSGCGAIVPIIPRLGELHRAVAKELLGRQARLTGNELRFLRKNAGIQAAQFAVLLGIDPATLSRFETGRRPHLGPPTDKLARAIVGIAIDLPHELRSVLMDAAQKLAADQMKRKRPTFKLERDHWCAA